MPNHDFSSDTELHAISEDDAENPDSSQKDSMYPNSRNCQGLAHDGRAMGRVF